MEVSTVRTSGSPFERGHQHGLLMQTLIKTSISEWLQNHGEEYISRFLLETDFLSSIREHTPELLEELEGMAQGSGLPLDHVLAYNLMDEEWQFSCEERKKERGDEEAPGCTVVYLRHDDGGACRGVIGQTMDLPHIHDGAQIVLAQEDRDSGASHAVITAAGMLGLCGVNSKGVGIVVNNLSVLPSARTGLPVMFVLRGALGRSSLAEAVDFVRSVPHATGQHYLIGSHEGIVSVECSASGVSLVPTDEDRGAHSNHPHVSTPSPGDHASTYAATNSFERLRTAQQLLGRASDVGDVEAVLGDTSAPISRAPQRGVFTFFAMTVQFSDPPRMRVAVGPPHLSAFQDAHDLPF